MCPGPSDMPGPFSMCCHHPRCVLCALHVPQPQPRSHTCTVAPFDASRQVSMHPNMFQCIPTCFNASQHVSMHPSMFQCIPTCFNASQHVSMHPNMFQCTPTCFHASQHISTHPAPSRCATTIPDVSQCPPPQATPGWHLSHAHAIVHPQTPSACCPPPTVCTSALTSCLPMLMHCPCCLPTLYMPLLLSSMSHMHCGPL